MQGLISQKSVELTPRQREVVEFDRGPLLVVAGAGTGKTMCMAHRVAHLITSRRAAMDEILVLTFSEKAANEMEERVDLLLPYAFSDIWISTFHSFGQRLLKRHALEAGFHPDFRVLTPEEMVIFLKNHLFQLPMDIFRPPSNPAFHLRAVSQMISRLKDEDISPEEYFRYADSIEESSDDPASAEKKSIHRELALIYKKVQDLLFAEGFVDMADLIYLPLQILREHPLVAEEYRKRFKYILVDEFQDTNYSQYQVLKLLAAGRKNITVVGDDDQSIYKFRGAAISNILSFMEDFPEARQVVLTDNFRSPQRILDAAYRLITHNNPYRMEVKNSIDKRLRGKEDPKAVLSYKVFDTEQAQAESIAELIRNKAEGAYNLSDIAVLIRTNRSAEPIIRELSLRDIPFNFSGSSGLYMRPEIRNLLCFFRALTRPDESIHLFYLAGSEIYGLKGETLTRLSLYADRAKIALEEVFKNIDEIDSLRSIPSEEKEIIGNIISHIRHFREISLNLTCGRLLYEFLAATGFLSRLARRGVDFADVKTRNIAIFFDIIKSYEIISLYPHAQPFIKHVDELIDAGEDPPAAREEEDLEAVSILTVHKSKGLEFPLVIIAGLAEGKFPSINRSDIFDLPDELVRERMISEDFHIQEERRLFYVAMTRSKGELYLYGARNFGGKRPRKVSRFLMEALDMPVGGIKAVISDSLENIENFAPPCEMKEAEKNFYCGGVDVLTPMQFDDYITCPMKYKYVHILRIPVLTHHRVVYGKAVRESVREFLRRKTEKIPVERDDILEIFRKEWSLEGFLSREHEEMRFAEGKKALGDFYDNFRNFVNEEDSVDREYRFYVDETKVMGRWDLLRQSCEGPVIFDFRSSDVRDEKYARRKTRESLKNQISVLAYYKTFRQLPAKLQSYFIDSGFWGDFKPDEKMLNQVEDKLRLAIDGIGRGNYGASPEAHKCNFCAFVEICPATAVDF